MAKKEQETEPRRTWGAWAWLSGALAAFAIVATSLSFVVVGPLTVESQPGSVLPTVAPVEDPIPAPAVTASPADVATSTATDLFDAPDITVVAPPEPPKKGVRAPSGTGGTSNPYYGLTAAQYCALKLPAYSTSGSDVTAFLYAANKERAETGAPALSWNSTLASAAQGWSDQMASDHTAHPEWPWGSAEWLAGVFRHSGSGYAENIAANFGYSNPVNVAQSGWMKSTGHCLSIMNPNYTQFGAGKTQAGDGSWFFTEEFIW